MDGPRFVVTLALFLSVAAACGDEAPRTQVTAVVRAEPGIQAAATRIEVVVTGMTPGGETDAMETLAYGDGETNPLSFPVDIAIVPGNGDATRTFEVAVSAFDGERAVASVTVPGAFEAGRTLTLDVWLRDGGADGGLDGGTDGGTDGGPDGSLDGSMDSSMDGSMDSAADATRDAASDAPDAGPSPLDLYNVVFVTSRTYQGGSLGGLGGADIICQTHATEAGLPRPMSYVALLSTSDADARDRLGTSRGWVRVDGRPFGDEVSDIASGQIYYPVGLSELGIPPAEGRVMTATNPDLTKAALRCGNWADTSALVAVRGDARDGTARWVDLDLASPAACSANLGIYCFGTGIIRELVPAPPPEGAALAFVSNDTRNGRMGIAALDTLCSDAATGAGLGGSFKALVTPRGGENAVSRLTFTGPWYRPDGILVASTLADVAAASLESSLSVTADGFSYGNFRVWFGASSPSATSSSSHCSQWSAVLPLARGRTGRAGAAHDFFSGPLALCSADFRVLCLEDRP